jgi:Putative esterase
MNIQRFYSISCVVFIGMVSTHINGSMLIVDEVPIVNSNVRPSPLATGNVRLITVYLPAQAIQNPTQRFPSIYYLPGLGGDNNSFTTSNQTTMDDLIAAGQAMPMIIIHVDPSVVTGINTDGERTYQGTWYVNSTLNGNFEDFMVSNLVPFVDAHYQTIPEQPFRGVMGQSMGGYGSIYHGVQHPELYCAFGSASGTPFWVLADNAVPIAPPQDEPGFDIFTINSLIFAELPTSGPNENIVTPDNGPLSFSIFSYAGAFSPNVNNPPYFVDLPFEVDADSRAIFANGSFIIANTVDGTRIPVTQSLIPRPEILALWKDHDPYFLMDNAIATLKKQSIYVDGGDIELINAAGARVISDKLSSNSIDHLYVLYMGDHTTCLESELCSRHQTMFQMMSNQFARAGIFADDVRTRFVGTGSIIIGGNSLMSIDDKALVGIETAPDLSITNTNIAFIIQDNATLQLGTTSTNGGVLQFGNRFTKALLQGNPSLESDTITASITINGPGATLEVGQQGILGVGSGVDGNHASEINFTSITSLTNLDSFDLNLVQGNLILNQIGDGTQASSSLMLMGPSEEYTIQMAPTNTTLLGGSNIVETADCLWRHPVALNQVGENDAGGVLNDLDTSETVVDFFYKILIGSELVYDDVIEVGTATTLSERDDRFVENQDPDDLVDGTLDDAYNFLAINQNDDYDNSDMTSKEGAIALVDGIIVLTYVDNGTIIRIPESAIPIAPGQNIDLQAIAQTSGTVLVWVEPINGFNTLIRIDNPLPRA